MGSFLIPVTTDSQGMGTLPGDLAVDRLLPDSRSILPESNEHLFLQEETSRTSGLSGTGRNETLGPIVLLLPLVGITSFSHSTQISNQFKSID